MLQRLQLSSVNISGNDAVFTEIFIQDEQEKHCSGCGQHNARDEATHKLLIQPEWIYGLGKY